MSLHDMRALYKGVPLLEGPTDPVALLQQWIDDAVAAKVEEPNAMIVSTVAGDQPRARTVLLRGLDQRGLVFYTNYDSDKGHELLKHPKAAITFLWTDIARQVRVEGDVVQVSLDESDAYFRSRPRGHQISAWASEQSRVVASRTVLEQQEEAIVARFKDMDVPRPPHWGGFRVVPRMFEFWQGRSNRMHDRLRFSGTPWVVERLNP